MAQRQRVAIIGGGMAALTAAYMLSSTPQHQSRYAITVYQMGWRLGGKCASSRDRDGRIIEHGLHVWFGCYANAFGLMRQVYERWTPQSESKYRSVADIFQPRPRSLIGDFGGGRNNWHEVSWPERPGVPWDDGHEGNLRPWNMVATLLAHLQQFVAGDDRIRNAAISPSHRIDHALRRNYAVNQGQMRSEQMRRIFRAAAKSQEAQTAETYLDLARQLSEANADLPPAAQITASEPIRDLVAVACDSIEEDTRRHGLNAQTSFTIEMIEILRAYIIGIVDDLLLGNETLDTLDTLDFREWLVRHGASHRTTTTSPAVKALYDTMFQYVDGDDQRPSFAAGTALQVVARIVATYRGSAVYVVNRGMGEVVLGPLYEVLKQQGVHFAFFHKADALEASADGRQVETIRLQQQAKLCVNEYQPIRWAEGMPFWPDQPDWNQLVDGKDLQKAGADFESHWDQTPPADKITLRRGQHFDTVILGVSLGALKGFGRRDGMVESLASANPNFHRMIEGIDLVPSMSLQLWSNKSAEDLGHTLHPRAAVSGPEPIDIHADMSHLLEYEEWPSDDRPLSLFYLCSVLPTQLFRRPNTDESVPAEALELVRQIVANWLARNGTSVWPSAVTPQGQFDTGVIQDRDERANVNPTDCCPASAAGTTQRRLPAGASGFENLVLTGCWTRTGLNTTCVEAAVMSGMQAARHVSGTPYRVVGEDFLRAQTTWSVYGQAETCFNTLRHIVSSVLGKGAAVPARKGGRPRPFNNRRPL